MKRVFPLLCIGVLAMLVGCGKPDVAALLQESRELARKGDQESWEQIRENLHKVLKSGRVSRKIEGADRLHNFCVQSLLRTDRPQEALKAAERSVAYFPESFMSNYLLGKIYHDNGDYVKAVPFLEKALSLKAQDANTLALLTVAAGKTNNPNAGNYFAQAAELPEFSEDSRLYNEWGLWLIAQEKPLMAVKKLAIAARQDDVDPGVYMNLGVLYDRHLQKRDVAKNYYMRFLAAMRNYPESRTDARLAVQNRLRELK